MARSAASSTRRWCHTQEPVVCAPCGNFRNCRKTAQATQTCAVAPRSLGSFFTLAALGLSNQFESSRSRNLHCLPIRIAGISLHSAQRHSVLVETPSHLATAAVVISGSRLDDASFSISLAFFVEERPPVEDVSRPRARGRPANQWRKSESVLRPSFGDPADSVKTNVRRNPTVGPPEANIPIPKSDMPAPAFWNPPPLVPPNRSFRRV